MIPKPIRIRNKDLLAQKRLERCISCDSKSTEAHHVLSRGAGGWDIPRNLMSLCRLCHTQIHQYGLSKMSYRSPKLKDWLDNNDWQYDETIKKWRQK